jgi:hypothetical protein
MEEITGGWRKLHKEELHNLYSTPNVMRRMRLVEHGACTGYMRNSHTIFVRKHGRKRLLRRFRH